MAYFRVIYYTKRVEILDTEEPIGVVNTSVKKRIADMNYNNPDGSECYLHSIEFLKEHNITIKDEQPTKETP